MDNCSKLDHPAHRSEQEQLNMADYVPPSSAAFPERCFQTVPELIKSWTRSKRSTQRKLQSLRVQSGRSLIRRGERMSWDWAECKRWLLRAKRIHCSILRYHQQLQVTLYPECLNESEWAVNAGSSLVLCYQSSPTPAGLYLHLLTRTFVNLCPGSVASLSPWLIPSQIFQSFCLHFLPQTQLLSHGEED